MSKVVADTVHTPLFDRYAYNWSKARYKATKDSSSVYVLSGVLYEYQKFNENALVQNKITISNNKYFDKFIGGVWQNPYETKIAFALTTPLQQSRSKKVYFKLPSNLFLSNLDSQIATIQINADNGQGYKNLPFDSAVQLQFFENKIHNITYKITLTNNEVLYCRSKFKIDDPTLDSSLLRGSIVINDERVYVYEDGNFFNAAWLTIRRMPGNVANNQITRPFIIAEGLDTGNFTAPEDFGGERTFEDFRDDINTTGEAGNLATLLDDNQQYDLIYIDWVRGMADMRANSRVLEEVIKWVNAQKALSGNPQPNVLLGQSMGGVIGRYTLARMEHENKLHDVRLFIAHDSPMQGANTPLAIQHFSIHMRQEYASTPLLWGIGEVLVPIGFGLAQLGENFLNFFGGNNNNIPAYVTPSQLLSLQDQTASRQLNYWSALEAPSGGQLQTRSFNQSWQQTLTNMGWPTLSRNIAISNGNECSASNGFAPGAPLLVINSRSNPGFWLDALNSLLAPLVGAVTQDIGLIIVGALPGRSRWQTNFDFNSYGVQGSQNLIYRGRIRFEKKLLWIGPTIIHNLINKSFNAPAEALPFDTYSGGRLGFLDENGNFIVDIPILSNLVNVVNAFYGFIPVVSALDIKRNNAQVIPADYVKKYAGGVTPEPALTSGFNNFIVDFNTGNSVNNQHISFQARNGNWLAEELNVNLANPIYPVANCSYVCRNNQITGPSTICDSSIFSAPTGATTYTWSITQGASLVTITSNGAPSVTLTNANNGFGYITLSVTFGSELCGNITLTKKIYVGLPTFNNLTYRCGPSLAMGDQFSATPAFSAPDILKIKNRIIASFTGLTSTEAALNTNWEWSEELGNNLLLLSGTGNSRSITPLAAGTTTLQIRVQNACGWSDYVYVPMTIILLPPVLEYRPSQPSNSISLKANTLETNPSSQYAWNNENIWIRNMQDGITEHQNPINSATTPNYLYARIVNSGCRTLPSTYSLRTYWSKASTSLNWPQSWNDAKYNNTQKPLGGLIGEVAIPELLPEQETIISMPFMVPDPAQYQDISSEPWRFGLLARAISLTEPMSNPETNDLVQNVATNENIAWKNVTLVDFADDNPDEQSIGGVIAVGNTFNTPKSFYLELVKEDLETGKPIYDEAEVSLKLDETLYQAWVRGGKTAERLENTLDEKVKLVKDNNVFLKDLELNANETGTLYVKFNFLTQEITDKSKYVYHVIQRETGTNKIIGGETYVIKKQERPLFTAEAGGTKYVDKNEPITISAAQLNEPAIYNWYDSDGNLVATGKDLSISTDVAQKFKLEVITTDGFKDYTEVEVKLKPNALNIISPNPAGSNVNITYKLNEVSSAYLMILGSYGTTGTSNNYILDINSTEINIDLSSYSNGFYTIALVCDGQIVDAKTLVKQ